MPFGPGLMRCKKISSSMCAQLDGTTDPDMKAAMQEYFVHLQQMSKSSQLDRRAFFMVHDLLKLRESEWVVPPVKPSDEDNYNEV